MSRSRKKKRVSETENELVVRIPLVVGFRPVVVQPEAIVVAFQVEHVRVAVGVGFVRRAVFFTADLGADEPPEAVLYSCVIENHPACRTKYFLFMDCHANPPREAMTARALNPHEPKRS